jgi:hypothetical protein
MVGTPRQRYAQAMSTAARRKRLIDPTVYPVEDDVGEDSLQTFILETLRPLIAALLARRGEKAFVGSDQFIYWEQYNPSKVVAPDVYVLPGVAPNARVPVWKVWETHVVPSFALEIMSEDQRKDVEESPRRCAELGVRELIVFDPEPETRRDGIRFRVFRTVGKRGLVLVEATNEDRVRSKVLDAWIRVVGRGLETRLRVGLGPKGEELLPTAEERAEAEARRAETEAQRAQAEAQRAERAEARIAELEQRLRERSK